MVGNHDVHTALHDLQFCHFGTSSELNVKHVLLHSARRWIYFITLLWPNQGIPFSSTLTVTLSNKPIPVLAATAR
jgi:hypothetical protein